MCEGNCNDLLTLPSVTTSVVNGVNGTNAYVYIASADNSSGLNFTYPQNSAQAYVAILNTTVAIASPISSNFNGLWRRATGINGTNGTDGVFGGICYEYQFGAANFTGDPGSGYVNLNSLDPSLATIMSISDFDVNGIDLTAALYEMMNSSNTPDKGYIRIVSKTDSSKFIDYFIVSSLSIGGLYQSVSIQNITTPGFNPFLQNDPVLITISKTGNKGGNGNSGVNGSIWRDGSGVPSNGLGANGDYYLNDATGDVYLKTTGTYSIVTNIKGTAGTNGLGYKATSISSKTVAASGSFTFVTVEVANTLAYSAGARVRVTSTSSGDFLEGVVTSYSGQNLIFTADYAPIVGNTYNAWNINLTGNVGSTGVSGGLLSTTLSISSAQVLTLNSVPVQILAAPGAGLGYEIDLAASSLNYNSIAYTNNNPINIVGATTGIIYASLSANILTETTSCIYGMSTFASTSFKLGVNEILKVQSTVGDPATGNSTMKFYLTYKVITI